MKKLKLDVLNVQSFATSLNQEQTNTVKGGNTTTGILTEIPTIDEGRIRPHEHINGPRR